MKAVFCSMLRRAVPACFDTCASAVDVGSHVCLPHVGTVVLCMHHVLIYSSMIEPCTGGKVAPGSWSNKNHSKAKGCKGMDTAGHALH